MKIPSLFSQHFKTQASCVPALTSSVLRRQVTHVRTRFSWAPVANGRAATTLYQERVDVLSPSPTLSDTPFRRFDRRAPQKNEVSIELFFVHSGDFF